MTSEVPLLNIITSSSTTLFHFVFNDLFATVLSIEREDEPPSHWEDLCLENTTLIPTDTKSQSPLNSEWHSAKDTKKEHRDTQCTNRVRSDMNNNYQNTDYQAQEPLYLPNPRASTPPPPSQTINMKDNHTASPPFLSTEGGLPASNLCSSSQANK